MSISDSTGIPRETVRRKLAAMAVSDPASFKTQYGTDRFTPIFSRPLADEARVEFGGKNYMVTRQNLVEVVAPAYRGMARGKGLTWTVGPISIMQMRGLEGLIA